MSDVWPSYGCIASQLRARDMLSGAEFGMLGVTLFFIMALLSILEGIEVPLLRLRKFVFSRWLRREPKPVAAATMIKLERASRVLLVLSRLVVRVVDNESSCGPQQCNCVIACDRGSGLSLFYALPHSHRTRCLIRNYCTSRATATVNSVIWWIKL